MNEDAAKELVEFVGQLAASVAVLSHGMKVLMNVVADKDREIKALQESAKDRLPHYYLSDWKGGAEVVYTPPSYSSDPDWLWSKPLPFTITKGDTKS